MKPEELQKAWLAFRGEVRVADIFLVHDRKGIVEGFIRKTTGSYWNHSFIVFETWDNLPFGGPLIVDIGIDGVAIHRLKKYTDDLERYDFGVLRYPGLTAKEEQDFVKGFILDNIDTPYDFRRILGLIFKSVAKKMLSRRDFIAAAGLFINDKYFVCSSFVRKAFHRFREQPSATLDADSMKELKSNAEMYTPADIASDRIFTWLFNERR
jgi:hypothetical protein